MTRVTVNPRMLLWARERSQVPAAALKRRFAKLDAWERGEVQPTLKQLEEFARATHAPIGFLFLQEPPVERVPIPDLRTVRNERKDHPSPDLLETIYICEQRQEWYREFAHVTREDPLPFVGSLTVEDDITRAAHAIRDALRLDIERRRELPTWSEALRDFMGRVDEMGVLVMSSGIVGSNTHRKLDPEEFRGFALVDPLAPVVFINGADTRAAQMFTLAHEIAHVWLGRSALSDSDARLVPHEMVESWCNRVAAEILVPLDVLRTELRPDVALSEETARLARRFKVSTLVILRRIHDAGGLSRARMWELYEAEIARLRDLPTGSGGNFYLTLPVRVSRRFARALVTSTLEGRTLYRDALHLLGFAKLNTFDELVLTLGVPG